MNFFLCSKNWYLIYNSICEFIIDVRSLHCGAISNKKVMNKSMQKSLQKPQSEKNEVWYLCSKSQFIFVKKYVREWQAFWRRRDHDDKTWMNSSLEIFIENWAVGSRKMYFSCTVKFLLWPRGQLEMSSFHLEAKWHH